MRDLKIGGIYKHFKGNVYTVEDIVYDAETNSPQVLYKGKDKRWVRPLNEFLSKVDINKYPDINQKYRFELLEDEI